MKKVLLSLTLACSLAAGAAWAGVSVSKLADDEVKVKRFRIHLVSGGTITTESYVFEGGKVKINLPGNQGAIRVNRSQVKKIEEVEDGEPVRKVFSSPPTAPKPTQETEPAPSGQGKTPGETRPDRHIRPGDSQLPEGKDMNGNNRDWWLEKVEFWKKKLADAQKRYDRASVEWNKYNGIITNPAVKIDTDFSIQQFTDLRGAARVDMDQATAELEEAKRMLEEVLPEEARKAGAPPGWLR